MVEGQVLRGRPVPEFEHKSASANDRQASEWLKDPRVQLVRRDLKNEIDRKLGKFQAREKGIDVALVIAVVESAILGRIDSITIFKLLAGKAPDHCGFLSCYKRIHVSIHQIAIF